MTFQTSELITLFPLFAVSLQWFLTNTVVSILWLSQSLPLSPSPIWIPLQSIWSPVTWLPGVLRTLPCPSTFTPLRLHSPWPHRLVFLLFWPSETHACLLLYLSDSPHSQVVHLTICISLYSHIGDTQHSFVAQSKKLRIWKSFPIYRLMSHNVITFSCVLIGEDAGGRSGFQDAKGCPAVS